MLTVVYLLLVVYLFRQLAMLRACLAFVFPRILAKREDNASAPEGMADRYEVADAELRALGFEGPHWYSLQDADDPAESPTRAAAYHHADSLDTVWLHPFPTVKRPHDLAITFVRPLRDGRMASSQVLDPYCVLLADARTPAQTLSGGTLQKQWADHGEWCASLGETDAEMSLQERLDFQAAEFHNERRASLLKRGLAYLDRRGLARPSLRLGLRMWSSMRRMSTAGRNSRPIPAVRMVLLAEIAQRVALRPVPMRVQAGLFALSVALFLAIGGIVWGARFAAILLVVVTIHELGHFLAMRAFGYRNVQMLTLPLVGGVTIGHETHPDATRRAWMSLMGPLPGIVIGWCLLIPAYTMFGDAALGAWLREAAWVMLAINYLNVLPVPPLDGAHVVQALLPARSVRIRGAFVAIACITGGLLALWAKFYLLAALAGLRLYGLRVDWQLARVLDRLFADPRMAANLPSVQRQQRAFEVFDEVIGPTSEASTRLGLANEALRGLDLKPMRAVQRTLVAAIYAVLLLVPLLAAVLAVQMLRDDPGKALALVRADRANVQQEKLQQQVQHLDLRALLVGRTASAEAETVAPLRAPASETAIAAAEQRLGLRLPPDLVAAYRIADGTSSIPVRPLAELRRAGDITDLDLSTYAIEGQIPFWTYASVSDKRGAETRATAAQASRWLVLDDDREIGSVVLYDADEPSLNSRARLYVLDTEGSHATAGLRTWLESRWVSDAQSASYQQEFQRTLTTQRAATAHLSLAQLLDTFKPPTWWLRTLFGKAEWSPPADRATIEATGGRLGHALPDDLAQVYARSDGFRPLALLSLSALQAFSAMDVDLQVSLKKALAPAPELASATSGTAVTAFEPGTIDDCIAISGGDANKLRWVAQWWCPMHPPAQRYIDIAARRTYATYTEIVRERVAHRRAASAVRVAGYTE